MHGVHQWDAKIISGKIWGGGGGGGGGGAIAPLSPPPPVPTSMIT